MERGSIYPSWRFHPDGRSALCLDAVQDNALGEAWSDADVRSHAGPEVTMAQALESSAPAIDAAPDPPVDDPTPQKRGRKPKA